MASPVLAVSSSLSMSGSCSRTASPASEVGDPGGVGDLVDGLFGHGDDRGPGGWRARPESLPGCRPAGRRPFS